MLRNRYHHLTTHFFFLKNRNIPPPLQITHATIGRMNSQLTFKTALSFALLFLSIHASAQYGTAPNNYYPGNYNGSTFKGVVTETKDNQLTLAFTTVSGTESFTGQFETGCSVPTVKKGGRAMIPTDIPKGTTMTAFFNTRTQKVDGKKIKENLIIAIAFDIWMGQKVPEDKKRIYLCVENQNVQFKAFQEP